jgi:hypothetical protein
MTIRISGRSLAALGLVLVIAATAFVLVGRSNADPKSTPLHGTFGDIQNFFPPACTSVTTVCSSFDASGTIQGTGIVDVDTAPDANGYSQAHTTITTNKGTLTCHEQAIFDVGGNNPHPFVDLCLIDGGTGLYAGATGYIQEVGLFNFGGVGSLDYYGQITYGG